MDAIIKESRKKRFDALGASEEVRNKKYAPLVIVGPSGVGKGTLIKKLMEAHPIKF